jgi:hypothetical protein
MERVKITASWLDGEVTRLKRELAEANRQLQVYKDRYKPGHDVDKFYQENIADSQGGISPCGGCSPESTSNYTKCETCQYKPQEGGEG